MASGAGPAKNSCFCVFSALFCRDAGRLLVTLGEVLGLDGGIASVAVALAALSVTLGEGLASGPPKAIDHRPNGG